MDKTLRHCQCRIISAVATKSIKIGRFSYGNTFILALYHFFFFLFRRQTESWRVLQSSVGHTKYQWSLPRLSCTLEKRYKELSSAVLLAFGSSVLLVTVGAAVVFLLWMCCLWDKPAFSWKHGSDSASRNSLLVSSAITSWCCPADHWLISEVWLLWKRAQLWSV